MVTSRVISDVHETEGIQTHWDRLAVAAGRPFCAPAWMISWWSHAAPADALLRIVVVEDNGELIGIAPLYAHSSRSRVVRYRFLSSPVSKYLEPLAAAGRDREVATEVANALSDASPRPDLLVFDGIPVGSRWPTMLRDHWPAAAPPWERNAYVTPSPIIDMTDSTFEEWWGTRSGRWRKDLRRQRRHLGSHSVEFRLAKGRDVTQYIHDFAVLHKSRWAPRGGSFVFTRGVDLMLVDAARQLAEKDRLRLWTMEADGRPISSHLFVVAGGEAAYWLGGFDDNWAWCSPAMQVILEAVRHAWAAGDARFNLGAGAQPYKYRFANGEELLHWSQIAPRGPRYALTRLALAPSQVREKLAGHISEKTRERIKRAISRS